MTSSRDVVDCEDRVMLSPSFDAARAASISPSPPASFCIALGENAIGIDDLQPNTVVVVSTLLTSLSTLGRIYNLDFR